MPRYSTKPKPKSKPNQKHLPLLLALSGLGLVLIAVWAIWSSNAQPKANIEVAGAPRLKVEQDTIDHGDVKLGTTIHDDVRVTNIGGEPLRFSEAPYIQVLEGC